MSDEVLVKVNCHYSGQFKTENDVLDYVDGVCDVVEVDGGDIFTNLVNSLLVKKIDIGKMWYKLPFEDLGDKHPLWQNADVNKKKMQSAGRWMRELDVYVEKPVVEEFQLQSIIDENPSDGESDSAYEPEGEDEMSDDEAIDDEDGLSENSESADEDEVGEADIEVFNHDSYEDQIPDEDEVYHATEYS